MGICRMIPVVCPPDKRIKDRVFDHPDGEGAPEKPGRKIHPALSKDEDQNEERQGRQLEQPISKQDTVRPFFLIHNSFQFYPFVLQGNNSLLPASLPEKFF